MADKIRITPEELIAQADRIDYCANILEDLNTKAFNKLKDVQKVNLNVIKNLVSKTSVFRKNSHNDTLKFKEAAGFARQAAATYQNMDTIIRKNIENQLSEDVKKTPVSNQRVMTEFQAKCEDLMNTEGFREGDPWGDGTYVYDYKGQIINGYECYAMAHKMQVEITGKSGNPTGLVSFDDIQPGDAIHFTGAGSHPKYGHWVFVISKTDDAIVVAEGNVNGGKVHWNRTISRNDISIDRIDR